MNFNFIIKFFFAVNEFHKQNTKDDGPKVGQLHSSKRTKESWIHNWCSANTHCVCLFFLFIIDSYACKCYFRVCDWSTCHFWAKQMRIDNRRAFVTLKNFDQNNINKLSMFLECPSKLHTQNRRQYAIASENNQQWFKFLVNELTTRHRQRWRKKNTHTSQHKIGFSKLILISNST